MSEEIVDRGDGYTDLDEWIKGNELEFEILPNNMVQFSIGDENVSFSQFVREIYGAGYDACLETELEEDDDYGYPV
tara:strand:+ start:482 stop:709 length:228 start_codon:yes stop_codon:yes gene_type:complete